MVQDEYLLLPKLLYLTANMSVYASYTYVSNYFAEVWRIPIHKFGYLSGLSAASFAGSLLWTMLADRTNRHKLILFVSVISYALLFCSLKIEHPRIMMDGWKREALVSFAYGGSNLFISAIYPLLDNRMLLLLSKDTRYTKDLFGRQRLWGTVGQVLITGINGLGIQYFGYDVMFVSLACSSLLFLLVVFFAIPSSLSPCNSEPTTVEEPKKEKRANFWRPFFELVTNLDFIFFLSIVLVTGYARGILGNFLPYYLQYVMHQSPAVYGIALQTRLVTEILFFFIGKQLLQVFGVYGILLLAQVSGALRALLYTVIPSTKAWSYAVFGIELLKGINNACLISAGVKLAHEMAPEGCETTAQGFVSGVYGNLANAAAGVLGGFILQNFAHDPMAFRYLFAATTVVSAVAIVLYILKYFFINRVLCIK